MSIRERTKNGKITKDHLDYVLRIIEIDLGSLKGSRAHIKAHRERKEEFKKPRVRDGYDAEGLLEIHSLFDEMIMHYQVAFAQNAFDFWEFFYKEEKPKEDEYYHFQFPIDLKKFKKKRVPEKELLEIMSKMNRGNEDLDNICELVCRNVDVFYQCMKVKVKRPTTRDGKKIIGHYIDKLIEAGKISKVDDEK